MSCDYIMTIINYIIIYTIIYYLLNFFYFFKFFTFLMEYSRFLDQHILRSTLTHNNFERVVCDICILSLDERCGEVQVS